MNNELSKLIKKDRESLYYLIKDIKTKNKYLLQYKKELKQETE